MEWCILMHMMWLKGKMNVRKNSEKKIDHRSFEMGDLSLLSLYWWCWCFPPHKVVTLLGLPDLMRNMPFTWGKCNLLPLWFQQLSGFSMNRFRHTGMILFSGWAVWRMCISLPVSRVGEGRTDTCFSRHNAGKWPPYLIEQPNWFLRCTAQESGSFGLEDTIRNINDVTLAL